MQNEDDLPRDLPAQIYKSTGHELILPVNALRSTLAMLARVGTRESSVFWYGHRGEVSSKVAGVFSPRQHMTRGNYHVGPDAMSEMVALVPDGWRPLAQIHSHPGTMVEHSRYDDRMVSSRRALSIVFPNYGRFTKPWPIGVGIHEFHGGYWHLLDCAEAGKAPSTRARTSIADPSGTRASPGRIVPSSTRVAV